MKFHIWLLVGVFALLPLSSQAHNSIILYNKSGYDIKYKWIDEDFKERDESPLPNEQSHTLVEVPREIKIRRSGKGSSYVSGFTEIPIIKLMSDIAKTEGYEEKMNEGLIPKITITSSYTGWYFKITW